jgi:tRNA (cytidine/uridine-2'-O-)-methyltransferase
VFNIILYQPEIPPNTGNIIRLCANTGARLHLIGPLGFELDDARLRRAGLDYHDMAQVNQYTDWDDFKNTCPEFRVWGFSTKADKNYDTADFHPTDGLMFGSETAGLGKAVLASINPDKLLRLPMRHNSRSMNLSNTVAVALYEALRQNGFSELS